MRKPLAIWSLFFLCCRALSTANADVSEPHLVKATGFGMINWSQGFVEANGKAMPPKTYQGNQQGRSIAVQTAIDTARTHLFHIIEKIQIDTDNQISDVLKADHEIAEKLKEMITNARVINQKYLTDGTVEVTIRMSLYGGFSQLMLPSEIKQIESIKPIPIRKKKSTATEISQAPGYKTRHYTGMVVDARGIGITPAISPGIVDENGEEVFGTKFASREFAVQQGMVGYAIDFQAAVNDPRVANRPLVIRGIKARGAGHCDIVVSLSDANRLRSHSNHLDFLKRCSVIVVADPIR
ncbi:MAG: hypothetical protein RBT11_02170 [Desulfobacterales bacterium]|jgi:hypothetical protein|nr:hypothetical protein [Desulfobacterales bacterium]